MNKLNKVECSHSSSAGDVECFSSRLTEIIGTVSARAFAMKADLSQTAIQKYSTGDSTPNVERLIAISKAAGVTVEWLVTGKGPKYQQDFDLAFNQYSQAKIINTPTSQVPSESFLAEFSLIPGYNVQVSAGWGSEGSDEAEPSRHLAFRKRWLKWRGFSEKDLVIVWAKGDSMEPVISNNNTLVINTAQKQLTDGNIFVLRNDNQLWVKRVQVRPGSWVLLSDNSNYPPFEVPMDEQNNFEVVGQVVHISKDVGN
jgi:phage repressor protein C with HTH and peptisase S24 domain